MKHDYLKRCYALLLIIASALAPAVVRAQKDSGEREVRQLFAGYPKSEALDYVIRSHQGYEWLDEHHEVLYATWFPEGDVRVFTECRVEKSGRVNTYREVYDWAMQAGRSAQLSGERLASLNTIADALPPGAEPPPPLDYLFIVSFKDKDKWATRLYDRRKMPRELTAICESTGVKVEPTQ